MFFELDLLRRQPKFSLYSPSIKSSRERKRGELSWTMSSSLSESDDGVQRRKVVNDYRKKLLNKKELESRRNSGSFPPPNPILFSLLSTLLANNSFSSQLNSICVNQLRNLTNQRMIWSLFKVLVKLLLKFSDLLIINAVSFLIYCLIVSDSL